MSELPSATPASEPARRDDSIRIIAAVSKWGRFPIPRVGVLLITLAAVAASLALHQSSMEGYAMSWDGFPLVRDAMNWERTQQALWQPFHNHLFPLFRLFTWGVVRGADRLSDIPSHLFFGWLIGVAISLLALYEFVSRATHSAAIAWVALLVAGITSTYRLSAGAYATTQIFFAVAFLLVVLMFLHSLRDSFRWLAVAGAFVMAILAAAWRTEGLLAGPVGTLYAATYLTDVGMRRRILAAVAPSLGSCVFLATATWLCGSEFIESPGTVAGAPLVSFNPFVGAYLSARLGTEHLLLWAIGVRFELPFEQFLVFFGVLALFTVYWLRRSGSSALAWAGLAIVASSYAFVCTTRGNLGMEGLRNSPWYLIFPQFGWSMFLSAGLARGRVKENDTVTIRQAASVGVVGIALYLVHHPLAVKLNEPALFAQQRRELRELERIGMLSREHGIDASTLSRAIGPYRLSGSSRFDGLSLLDLPPGRRAWRVSEVRRLVQDGSAGRTLAEPERKRSQTTHARPAGDDAVERPSE